MRAKAWVAVAGLAGLLAWRWSRTNPQPGDARCSRGRAESRTLAQETPFVRLPLGSVHPEGWLLRQLELQKAGLTGSARSCTMPSRRAPAGSGATATAGKRRLLLRQRADRLGTYAGQQELQHRARKWIDWTLQSQRPDGSFGPASNDDWWPRMIVLFYLRDTLKRPAIHESFLPELLPLSTQGLAPSAAP